MTALLISGTPLQADDQLADNQLTDRIRQLAEQGDREAQFSMGLRYDLGDGVERDPELAAQWFAKAAAAGVNGACLYLGMKYEFGAGVKQDKNEAVRWYEEAAVQGWPQAAFLLGSLYLSLPTPETVRGCAWLSIADDQGYPGAERAQRERCSALDRDAEQEVTALVRRLEERMASSEE
jgi:TPR repeat protein